MQNNWEPAVLVKKGNAPFPSLQLDKENKYLQSSGQNERIWNMEALKYPTKGFAATFKSFTPVIMSRESNFLSHINYDE